MLNRQLTQRILEALGGHQTTPRICTGITLPMPIQTPFGFIDHEAFAERVLVIEIPKNPDAGELGGWETAAGGT
jgi:hypothetical protein